jgi:triacylglycerol lipase
MIFGATIMSMTLSDSAAGDALNALFLAQACDLAYYGEPEGPARFRSELGLEAKLISVDNTQVYVAESDQALVVAFRGSEAPTTLDGFKDWLLTNANNYLILPEGRSGTDFAAAGVGARFHRGFLEALEMVWQPLLAAVEQALKAKERPLWLTGHSLGGALALLAAWRFQRNFLAVQEVVTFGAPMIGNEAASKAFEQQLPGKIFRYVDLHDLVPHLPSVSLVANAYTHCLKEVALGAAEAAASGLEGLKQAAATTAEGLLDAAMADQVWEVVKSRIDSHMIANYQARVEAKCKEQA